MSDKELVVEALGRMPESVTLEEIREGVAILAAIRRGDTAAKADRVISHGEVIQRSAAWIAKPQAQWML